MFRLMEEQELEIRNIDDVSMIHIYGLFDLNPVMNKSEYYTYSGSYPGIAVFYSKNRLINLCVLDKYYDELVEKIFDYYRLAIDKSAILMDDNTRQLLEAGYDKDSVIFEYIKKDIVEEPVIAADSTLSKRFTPMVLYFLEAYYKMLTVKFTVTGTKYGWRGSTLFHALQADKPVNVFFKVVKENDGLYAVNLSNFIVEGNSLLINIRFENLGLSVSAKSEYLDFSAYSAYSLLDGRLIEEHSVHCNGKELYAERKDIPPFKKPRFNSDMKKLLPKKLVTDSQKEINTDSDEFSIFRLPFELYYAVISRAYDSNAVTVKKYCGVYAFPQAGYSEERYWTCIYNSENKPAVMTDNMLVQKLLTPDGQIQSGFLHTRGNSNGEYTDKLEGRYVIS